MKEFIKWSLTTIICVILSVCLSITLCIRETDDNKATSDNLFSSNINDNSDSKPELAKYSNNSIPSGKNINLTNNTSIENQSYKFVDGYRVNMTNGNIEKADGFFSSNFIPVENTKTYYINFSYYSNNFGLAFYDSSKVFISGIKQSNNTSSSLNYFTFDIIEGAAYIKITGDKTLITQDKVIIFDSSDINNYMSWNLDINVSDYEKKAICSNGDTVDDALFRSVRVDLSNCKYIKVTTKCLSGAGYQSLAFYKSDGTFLSGSGSMGTTGERKTTTYPVPINAAYCIVCDRYNDLYPEVVLYKSSYDFLMKTNEYEKQLKEWIINEQPLKNHVYYGEKVVLDNLFSCERYGGSIIPGVSSSITEPSATLYRQSCAVYHNFLFQGFDKGYIKVYDISDINNIKYVDDFELELYSSDIHCGTLSFAPTISNGDIFPLLYVEYGIHHDNELSCIVQRVTTNSAELVQKIIFDVGISGTANITPYVGDDNKLYLWARETSDNDSHFFVFEVPDITESVVTLTQDDVIDSWVDKEAFYTYNIPQSIMVHNKKLYMLYGNTLSAKRGIAVYDLEMHIIVTNISLTDIVPEEPEGLALYKHSLLMSINDAGGIYKLDFD